MAMDLGDAKLTLNVNDKAFNSKMTAIGNKTEVLGKKFKRMGQVMVLAGVAIAGALAGMVVAYAKVGDEIAKMAKRTGFGTVALSELRHVAGLTGTDLASIEKATKKMSKTIVDASDGMVTYIRAFDRIGLSAEELLRLKPEEQFWAIARAIGDLENQTIKAATAVDIFGRAGTMLLPMLALTSEELDAAKESAHELGVIYDEEAAVAAERFTDAMLSLKTSIMGSAAALAEQLMPAISDFMENRLIPTITRITDWIRANEDLAITLGKVAGLLIVGGALLMGLGMVAKAIHAINVALIILHGISGVGWLKLAAGLAIAAAGIATYKGIIKSGELPATPISLTPKAKAALGRLPSMQFGGVVPGPIGAPVPVMAHGGEAFAGVGGRLGSTFNVSIGNFMGDEASLREFARTIKELQGQDSRRQTFSGINRLGYFPGSSSV